MPHADGAVGMVMMGHDRHRQCQEADEEQEYGDGVPAYHLILLDLWEAKIVIISFPPAGHRHFFFFAGMVLSLKNISSHTQWIAEATFK